LPDSRLTDGAEVISLTCPQVALYAKGRSLELIYARGLVHPRAVAVLKGLSELQSPVILIGN
jgi:hypothetical protein